MATGACRIEGRPGPMAVLTGGRDAWTHSCGECVDGAVPSGYCGDCMGLLSQNLC